MRCFARHATHKRFAQIRNLSSSTQRAYVEHVARVARHFSQWPAVFCPEEIRAYQVYLTNDQQLAPASVVIAVAALRFLDKVTLQIAGSAVPGCKSCVQRRRCSHPHPQI